LPAVIGRATLPAVNRIVPGLLKVLLCNNMIISVTDLLMKKGSSTFIVGGEISTRTFHGAAAGPDSLLISHAPFPLTPALSLGEREARSPLGKKTCGGIGESRFRFPRRPQPVFLLPEGEGQDEGEGGLQRPSRDLLF
jgi:hypothetical protein